MLSYTATVQGHNAIDAALMMLQTGRQAGRWSQVAFHPADLAGQEYNAVGNQLLSVATEIATRPLAVTLHAGSRDALTEGSAMSATTTNFTSFSGRLRASYSPPLLLSELLLKQWFEPVIPFTVMIALASVLLGDNSGLRIGGQFQFAHAALRGIRLCCAGHGSLCLISGGIDLSIGAILAACNFAALYFLYVWELPDVGGSSWRRWRPARSSAVSTASWWAT